MRIRSKSEERKRQIVSVTLELLATTSLERLTTRQIANALGITQPALFRHFRSRDDLLVAVVDDTRANLAELAAQVLTEGSAHEQLRILMARLFEYTERHPGLSALLFSSTLPAEGPVRKALKHILAMQAALVAELVREGQRKGEFDTTIAAEHAATAFIGLIQGTIFQWRLAEQSTRLGQDANALYRLWLDGVGVGTGTGSGVEPDGPVLMDKEVPSSSKQRTADPGAPSSVEIPPPSQRSDTSTGPDPLRPQIRELDVRPIIADGEDPFVLIAREIETLAPSSVLIVVTPFRPAPLVVLLQKRGHGTSVVEYGKKHFKAEIVIGGTPEIEDLRDLEPPEPLERVLERGGQLEDRAVYLARLPRFPRLLLPHLADRGLRHSIHEEPDNTVLLLLQKVTP